MNNQIALNMGGAGLPIQQPSFWRAYWNDLPTNTLESVVCSVVFCTIAGITNSEQKSNPTYGVLSNALAGGLTALIHAAISPVFKRLNNGSMTLAPEREWIRSGVAIGTVKFFANFIYPVESVPLKALDLIVLSTIRAVFATKQVDEAGYFFIRI